MQDEGPTSLKALKRQSVRSGAITLAGQGATVAINLVSIVVLARLLTPHDYGLVSMVVAFTAFAGLFRDLGLSTASVQRSDLSPAQLSSLFWINTGMGALLTLLTAAASPLVAWFYKEPALQPLTLLLSSVFVISALGAQHAASLQRTMSFGRKVTATVAGAATNVSLAVLLAWLGHAYWALAWGTVAGAAVTTLLLTLLSPFRPQRPGLEKGMGSVFRFGGHVTGFEIINYFHRNLDNILIGRVWGAASLGLYARAYQLLMFPLTNLRGPILSVAFPAMCRLKDQPANYRAYYRRVTSLMAYLSMPLVGFLYAGTQPLVLLVLGPVWIDAAPIFQALAFAAFLQPVSTLRGMVTLSSGKSSAYFWLGLASTVGSVTAFVVGLPWGPVGVALAYSASNYLLLYPLMKEGFRNTGVQPSDFFVSIHRPAIASVVAGAVCSVPALVAWLPALPALRLASLGGVFAVVWFAVIACIPGGWRECKDQVGLLRLLKAERKKT